MNNWTRLLLGTCAALTLGSCARDLPYAAPLGAELVVNPQELSVVPGTVVLFEALVWNSNDEIALNNILVTVKSYVPEGVIIVPESAILSYNDQADTSWVVDASEAYYELTNVNDEIQPDYLQTITDSHGIAHAYVYVKCLPVSCGGSYTNTCDETYDPTECEAVDANVVFSIGVDSETVTFKAAGG